MTRFKINILNISIYVELQKYEVTSLMKNASCDLQSTCNIVIEKCKLQINEVTKHCYCSQGHYKGVYLLINQSPLLSFKVIDLL